MSELKLLVCPCCNFPAEIDTQRSFRRMKDGQLRTQCAIYCTDCGLEHSECYDDFPDATWEDVISWTVDRWNKRIAPQPNLAGMDEFVTTAICRIRDGGYTFENNIEWLKQSLLSFHTQQTSALQKEVAELKQLMLKKHDALAEALALNVNWVSVAEPDMLEHLSEYEATIKMGEEALSLKPQGATDK